MLLRALALGASASVAFAPLAPSTIAREQRSCRWSEKGTACQDIGLAKVGVHPGGEEEASLLQVSVPRSLSAIQKGTDPGGEAANAEHSERKERTAESAVEVTVSIMLIGTVAYMMLQLYMVNFPDEDVRYYSSKTLGDSISLFVAVLVYESVNKCFLSLGVVIQADVLRFGQFFLWFVLLQAATAWLAGVLWDEETGTNDPEEEAQWRTRELRLRCISGMLAHIAGFAAISAWSELQSRGGMGSPAFHVTVIVPMAAFAMLGLSQLSKRIRLFIAQFDQKIDLSEDIWESAAVDAEEDVVSLAISFLSVNVVQFYVLGALANRHGAVEGLFSLAMWRRDAICMLISAIVAVASNMTAALFLALWHGQVRASLIEAVKIIQSYASMSFAWFLLFAVKAAVHYACQAGHMDTERIVPKVFTALGLSGSKFIAIVLLDILADASGSRAVIHEAVVKIILSLGTLVGFAWELCFSTAIESMEERVPSTARLLTLVALSVALSALVVPAYVLYIAPITEDCRRTVVRKLATGHGRTPLLRSQFSRAFTDAEPEDDESEEQ